MAGASRFPTHLIPDDGTRFMRGEIVRVDQTSGKIQIIADPGSKPTDLVLHVPVAANQTVASVRVNGKLVTPAAILTIPAAARLTTVDVELK